MVEKGLSVRVNRCPVCGLIIDRRARNEKPLMLPRFPITMLFCARYRSRDRLSLG